MKEYRVLLIALLAMFVLLGLTLQSCGSSDSNDSGRLGYDDDDNPTPDDDDDDSVDDDDVTDDDDDTTGDTGGQVINFFNQAAVSNATVEIISNTSGDPLNPPLILSPDASGFVNIDLPAGTGSFGVLVTGDGIVPSYSYDHVGGTNSNVFPLVLDADINTASAQLGVSLAISKGHFIGGAYWDGGDKAIEPVGCVEVEATPSSGNIHYMNSGGFDASLSETDPDFGIFAGLNFNEGTIQVEGTVGGTDALFLARKVLSGTVTFGALNFSTAENPTPDDCLGSDDDDDDDDDSIADEVSGTVQDISTQSAVAGATVELVNNDTGGSFIPAVIGTADGSGNITLEAPSGRTTVGVKVAAASYMTTYTFGVDVGSSDNTFNVFSISDLNGAAAAVGETIQGGNGQVYGVVAWDGPSSTEPVGCAIVTPSPNSGDVYYINSGGSPDSGLFSTDESNGSFLVFNMTPGAYDINANTDGAQVSTPLPKAFADAITIAKVFYATPGNPTPGDCGTTDDDDDVVDDDDDVVDDDDDVVDDDDDVVDDDDDSTTDTISGTVLDLTNSSALSGATVELIDNSTGASFVPAVAITTSGSGTFSLEPPVGESTVGLKITATSYMDTYRFGVDAGTTGESYYVIGTSTYSLLLSAFSASPDPSKAQVFGAVSWDDGAGSKEVVGCTEVDAVPTGGLKIYFDNGGDASLTQSSTGTELSYFFIANIDTTSTGIKGDTDGSVVTTDIPVFFPGALHLVEILYDNATYSTNPTPGSCTSGQVK